MGVRIADRPQLADSLHDRLIVLGRVNAAHGVRGWLRASAFGDDPLAWEQLSFCLAAPTAAISSDSAGARVLHIDKVRAQGSSLLIQFREIQNREAAHALVGWFFGAPRSTLPRLADDEYYWDDLIGMKVTDFEGKVLGNVSGLIDVVVHQTLSVSDGHRQWLIPLINQYVTRVDLQRRQVETAWHEDWT